MGESPSSSADDNYHSSSAASPAISPKSCPPMIAASQTFDSHDSHEVALAPTAAAANNKSALFLGSISNHFLKSPTHKQCDTRNVPEPVVALCDDASIFQGARNIAYLSVFSVFGAVVRMYLERMFGLDCEQGDNSVHDFLTPLSRRVCVTNSGKTTGGSVFIDLPANALGCFIVGLLVSDTLTSTPIPWFRQGHWLQSFTPFPTALKVGFCGCLTTCK
jgi:fluoride ion exporter CrcB/FEX